MGLWQVEVRANLTWQWQRENICREDGWSRGGCAWMGRFRRPHNLVLSREILHEVLSKRLPLVCSLDWSLCMWQNPFIYIYIYVCRWNKEGRSHVLDKFDYVLLGFKDDEFCCARMVYLAVGQTKLFLYTLDNLQWMSKKPLLGVQVQAWLELVWRLQQLGGYPSRLWWRRCRKIVTI